MMSPDNAGQDSLLLDHSYLSEFRGNFQRHIHSIAPDAIFAPPELYHYTDLNGLHGIVTGNDLWLNQAQYSNDAAEVQHGYQFASEIIADQLKTEANPDRREYLEQLATLIGQPTTHVYICCFCMEDNLLSQWRGYGANGTGVSIGFAAHDFRFVTGPDAPPNTLLYLWKVFYEPKDQQNILVSALNFGFDPAALGFYMGDEAAMDTDKRVQRAKHLIDYFVPTFKNEDFIGENEYRLIFTPGADYQMKPHFRVGRGMLIPYYSLSAISEAVYGDPFRLPIRSICVGPSAHKSLNADSVRKLLNIQNFRNPDGSEIPVIESDTPYRG
jgi:hypothetical protein